MISPTVLTAAQEFVFTTRGGARLALNGVLTAWNDSIKIRLAVHEYLKRDGGEVEPMGAAPGRWSFRCSFVGADCTTRYRNLVATVRREPRGEIVHPRLGTIKVGCEGVQSSEDPSAAIDVIDFIIDFVEDAVDTAVVSDDEVGPQIRATEARQWADFATSAIAKINGEHIANSVWAAIVAAQATYNDHVQSFAGRVDEATQSTAQPPDLGKLLENIKELRDDTLTDLTKILVYTQESDVSLTEIRTAIYLAYAACLQAYNALIAEKPPIVDYVVPTAMPLTVIAVTLYGRDARGRLPEIMTLNRVQTPYWIPQGTRLRVVAPVVRQ